MHFMLTSKGPTQFSCYSILSKDHYQAFCGTNIKSEYPAPKVHL